MQVFTPEDLVQYLYNEAPPHKTEAIKAALKSDFQLKEMLEKIVSGQQELEPLKLSPRKKTIDDLLNYAEKAVTELHPH